MLRRNRRRLDIAGDSQLSRIKTEQAILNFFDWHDLGNGFSVFRDNEFCLPGLHFIHNCQALRFELSRSDRFQESHLTMVIVPWSHLFKVRGDREARTELSHGSLSKPTGLYRSRLGPGAGKAGHLRRQGHLRRHDTYYPCIRTRRE